MTDKEFLEDMKTYRLDHEPDGWPAIQQSVLDRLISIAENALNSATWNMPTVMEWKEKAEKWDKLQDLLKEIRYLPNPYHIRLCNGRDNKGEELCQR